MHHHLNAPSTVQVDVQTGTVLRDHSRPGVQFGITEVAFLGSVPAPYLLLRIHAQRLRPPGRDWLELVDLHCTVSATTPRIVIGPGALNDGSTLYLSAAGPAEDETALTVPVDMQRLHAIEAERRAGVALNIIIRPRFRFTPAERRRVPQEMAPAAIPIRLDRDTWLEGLDAWGYRSTWVVEVQPDRLELPPNAQNTLNRMVEHLRDGRQSRAVDAVRELRLVMEQCGLKDPLEAAADYEKLNKRERTRVERLEMLRGVLWHCANTANHEGPDFQDWSRRETQLMVRSLLALLGGL